MNYPRTQSGQSLLEMIFAIGIILIVVSAVLALANSGITGQKASELQVTANNLAREGIETVRNIRDGNWLAGTNQAWDTGLVPPDSTKNTAIAVFDPTANNWSLSFDCTAVDPTIYTNSNGVYVNQSGGGNQPTIFKRCLTLNSICQDSLGQESIVSSCPTGQLKVGIKVQSTVTWVERNRNESLTLEDLLYEWK